jgi:hypothetical protein
MVQTFLSLIMVFTSIPGAFVLPAAQIPAFFIGFRQMLMHRSLFGVRIAQDNSGSELRASVSIA